MARPFSPFAGIKLTDQTRSPAGGTDQRLFAATPRPVSKPALPPNDTPPPSGSVPSSTNQPIKEPTKVASLEPRNLGSKEDQARRGGGETAFDLNQVPERSNTYSFTEAELWAIEDVKTVLERQYGLRATKYDIVRCGVHVIVEDFRRKGEQSIVVQRMRGKRER